MISLIFTVLTVAGSLFEYVLLQNIEGSVSFNVIGENAYDKFKNESGGHRWQRCPPTERNGRYHTSTITVAIFKDDQTTSVAIRPEDIEWFACRGSGNGGQNRNKRDTAVTVVHKPTGIRVRCEEERSQNQNKEKAIKRLQKQLSDRNYLNRKNSMDIDRKEQVGSGMRGDKIRTIRVRDNVVTNHLSGRKMTYDEYVKGNLSKIV